MSEDIHEDLPSVSLSYKDNLNNTTNQSINETKDESINGKDKQLKSITKLQVPVIKKSTDGKIDVSNLRKSKRIPKSCYQCYKRKVKCNFEIPCNVCISRNRGHLCSREPVLVDGVIANSSNANEELSSMKENEILKKKIKELEKKLNDLQKNNQSISSSPPLKDINDVNYKTNIDNDRKRRLSSEDLNDNIEPWEGYSITLDLLNKGIGIDLYSNQSDDQNLNYNTEEWLRLGNFQIKPEMNYQLEEGISPQSAIWNLWLDLIHEIGKRESDIIMKSALESWFLHNVVDKEKILIKHDEYWNKNLKDERERHITTRYTKSKNEYLWMGQWYALLCIGIFYSNDKVQVDLGFTMEQWEVYPKIFFSCAFEALYRGGYMTYYKIESIQLFCLLKLCAHALGGITLQNCLLSTNIYIARKLNLDKLTLEDELNDPNFDIKRRCWWYLVQSDWNENKGRYSLIDIDSYSTPLPDMWIIKNKSINWDAYYQRVVVHLGKIKKLYYYEDEIKQEEITLDKLIRANEELQITQREIEYDFKTYPDFEQMSQDHILSLKVEFSHFIIQVMIAHEIQEVNSKMSSYMSRELWMSKCHSLCVDSAIFIIDQFSSDEIDSQLKMPWYIPNYAISAGIFLLIDYMLNNETNQNPTQLLYLINTLIKSLGLYRLVMRPAARGIYIVQKLVELVKKKDNLAELKKMSFSDNRKVKRPLISSKKVRRSSSFHNNDDTCDEEGGGGGSENDQGNQIIDNTNSIPLSIRTNQPLISPSHFMKTNISSSNNYFTYHNERSELQPYNRTTNFEIDLPDSRYFQQTNNNTNTANGFQGNDITNIQNSVQFAPRMNTTPGNNIQNVYNQTSVHNRNVNFTSPEIVQHDPRHSVQEQHQLQQNHPEQQPPPLYTAILDILGNSGWEEFLNSIDDFNMDV